jgi:hypothetical protein
MRKVLIALAAAGGIGVISTSSSMGAPANGAAILSAVQSNSLVQDARVFCYNRATGRFLHWGSCGYARRVYNRPRVYCRNRYTGRFLYWGACR